MIQQPANSAAPSTQKASRTVAYAPAQPSTAPSAAALPSLNVPSPALEGPGFPAFQFPMTAQPLWIREDVETELGQHQDAAGIVKIAMTANAWTKTRWLGLLGVVLGLGGLLHSAGNDQGYPLVWIKTAVVGVILMIVSNPWWLLLGLIPLGFYAVQRLGLMRIP